MHLEPDPSPTAVNVQLLLSHRGATWTCDRGVEILVISPEVVTSAKAPSSSWAILVLTLLFPEAGLLCREAG